MKLKKSKRELKRIRKSKTSSRTEESLTRHRNLTLLKSFATMYESASNLSISKEKKQSIKARLLKSSILLLRILNNLEIEANLNQPTLMNLSMARANLYGLIVKYIHRATPPLLKLGARPQVSPINKTGPSATMNGSANK